MFLLLYVIKHWVQFSQLANQQFSMLQHLSWYQMIVNTTVTTWHVFLQNSTYQSWISHLFTLVVVFCLTLHISLCWLTFPIISDFVCPFPSGKWKQQQTSVHIKQSMRTSDRCKGHLIQQFVQQHKQNVIDTKQKRCAKSPARRHGNMKNNMLKAIKSNITDTTRIWHEHWVHWFCSYFTTRS